jgi:signal transduction histidine kinase/ABC-type nitrate/sulfonate/bicarbonate transport system substrate-binding protein
MMQRCIKKLGAIVFFCITCLPHVSQAGKSIEIVHLQLPWTHQFQFAGYYAAIEKGYYAKSGLHVVIHEGTPSTVIATVLNGQAQYGVGHSELLWARLQGSPLIALAAIFQHSPSILLTKKNIITPQDLIGKRVMISNKENITVNGDAEFFDLFDKQSVDINKLQILQSHFDINDLINDKTDAVQAYITNEVYALQKTGYRFNIINPLDYGVDFYSNVLFTTEDEVNLHTERANLFRQASLDGWRYALEHEDEIIELLHKKYHVTKTNEELVFESNMMKHLIDANVMGLGHLNMTRWHNMGLTFVKFNAVSITDLFERLKNFNFDSEEFLKRNMQSNLHYARWFVFYVLIIIIILLYFNNLRQHRENLQRKEIISLNSQLSHLQRLESINRLTAGIAHDFNNILACMVGFNQLNKYVAEDCQDQKIKDEILFNTHQVELAGERGADLIKKMMVYSRQNSTKKAIEVKQTKAVINEVLAMVRVGLTPLVQINTDIDSSLIIQIDAIDLHQILINLLVNARDAMQESGGEIKLRLFKMKTHELVCSACMQKLEGTFIELRLTDSGTGIEENVLKNIFDPFFTTKQVGEGTGLGLSTVSGMMHKAEGHIIVESKTNAPNRGTAFRLLFTQI